MRRKSQAVMETFPLKDAGLIKGDAIVILYITMEYLKVLVT
jgi:hypothetical protein